MSPTRQHASARLVRASAFLGLPAVRATAAVAAAILLFHACQREIEFVEDSDVSFLRDLPDDTGSGDTSTDGGAGSGCRLLSAIGCDDELDKCVPGADGANHCVPQGVLTEGEVCGLADFDDCGAGMVCAAAVAGEPMRCRLYCRDGVADCPDARTCDEARFLSDQGVGLCRIP